MASSSISRHEIQTSLKLPVPFMRFYIPFIVAIDLPSVEFYLTSYVKQVHVRYDGCVGVVINETRIVFMSMQSETKIEKASNSGIVSYHLIFTVP